MTPLDPILHETIAGQLARMDPWARLDYSASGLRAYLDRDDASLDKRAILIQGQPAALICLRQPWLLGPCIELLAVLPDHQNRGLGGQLINWAASRAGRNLWALVSAFNADARRFYARHGFVEIAPIPDLIRPGSDEILLRRPL